MKKNTIVLTKLTEPSMDNYLKTLKNKGVQKIRLCDGSQLSMDNLSDFLSKKKEYPTKSLYICLAREYSKGPEKFNKRCVLEN